MKWYAIYTKPGHENPVASRLRDIGIEVLNPKLRTPRYSRNRLIEVTGPLFPCYLFAHFRKNIHSHLVSYTRGVRYILGKQNPVAVHDEIIETIRKSMEDSGSVVISRRNFKRGDRVFIKDGPFKNFYGLFESEIGGPERVMILLDTICYKLELDSFFLAKA
jgi:transcriptional antiterminator RfaH